MASAYKPTAPSVSVDPAVSTEAYFECLAELIPRLPYGVIDAIAGVFFQAVQEGRTIFAFGNGGSAASASHMMCDLNKGAVVSERAPRPRVMALTDNVPLLTALANDRGYEEVFSEQLKGFVRAGDVAFAISASGNSPNVLFALQTARRLGAFTAGLAGFHGGEMKALCDLCAVVPSENVQLIEDLHQAMLHSIFSVVREKLSGFASKTWSVAAGGRP